MTGAVQSIIFEIPSLKRPVSPLGCPEPFFCVDGSGWCRTDTILGDTNEKIGETEQLIMDKQDEHKLVELGLQQKRQEAQTARSKADSAEAKHGEWVGRLEKLVNSKAPLHIRHVDTYRDGTLTNPVATIRSAATGSFTALGTAGTAAFVTGIVSLVTGKDALAAEKNLEATQKEARDLERSMTAVKNMLDNFNNNKKKPPTSIPL
jgi:hypothetical protein